MNCLHPNKREHETTKGDAVAVHWCPDCGSCLEEVDGLSNWQSPSQTPFFGRFFDELTAAQRHGGSELGLALSLFSLTYSLHASKVVEIGRYKGFSTLALASALHLLDSGWRDKEEMRSRKDMDYAAYEAPAERRIWSCDPVAQPEGPAMLERLGLLKYVNYLHCMSHDAVFPQGVDLAFIDGDHSYEGCMGDVLRVEPHMRPGGLMVLHDYFGPYEHTGRNISPVRQAIHTLRMERFPRYLLVDTGYPSFVVFRKPDLAREEHA
jgi:predicted O-methyltransferase YrrM